jgi:hypothetical protein
MSAAVIGALLSHQAARRRWSMMPLSENIMLRQALPAGTFVRRGG